MSFDWNTSNYKVVTLYETFSMISCKVIWKQTWDDYNCKKIWNICIPKELGSFLEESSLFPREVTFFRRGTITALWRSLSWSYFSPMNMVAPWSNFNLAPYWTWVFLESNLSFFFLLEHDCSLGQLKPPQEHGPLWKFCFWATKFLKLLKGNLFSSISFMDEKNI